MSDSGDAAAPSPPPPPAPRRVLRFRCPACGAAFGAPEALAGATVRCGRCGRGFRLPREGLGLAPEAPGAGRRLPASWSIRRVSAAAARAARERILGGFDGGGGRGAGAGAALTRFGLLALLVGGVLGLGAALAYVLVASRDDGREACARQLREIALAANAYARAHEGRLPDGYELYEALGGRPVRCPRGAEYRFRPGLRADDPGDLVYGFEDSPFGPAHGDGWNVLFVNGEVACLPRSALMAALERANEHVRTARRGRGEPPPGPAGSEPPRGTPSEGLPTGRLPL